MACHSMGFTFPERWLGRADIVFEIEKDKEKFGEFLMSNGAVVWFPKGKRFGHRVVWAELDKFFVDKGERSENR